MQKTTKPDRQDLYTRITAYRQVARSPEERQRAVFTAAARAQRAAAFIHKTSAQTPRTRKGPLPRRLRLPRKPFSDLSGRWPMWTRFAHNPRGKFVVALRPESVNARCRSCALPDWLFSSLRAQEYLAHQVPADGR